MKLPNKLNHPKKGLISIQNIDDNEWYLVRYLYPADHHPARLIKAGKYFARELDFKDIKFPGKIKDINKTVLSPLVFLVIKIRKNIQSMYQKNAVKKIC